LPACILHWINSDLTHTQSFPLEGQWVALQTCPNNNSRH